MRERDFTREFEEVFDHEPSSIDHAILNSADYVDWIIDRKSTL